MHAPLRALNNKITPILHKIKGYKDNPRSIGDGSKNNETISLKNLSALF
tara:strand:+ start:346 stop:492 length:147 start_codon:yes stop_codon:yes gene_type:complete